MVVHAVSSRSNEVSSMIDALPEDPPVIKTELNSNF
jgi:hypothetical protein